VASAPITLPFAPKPIAAELLSSWLLRVAAANFVSLSDLLKGFEFRYHRLQSESSMDYLLADQTMTALSTFCRVTRRSIRSLQISQRAVFLNPGFLLRFPQNSPADSRCTQHRARYGFCPLCIREQTKIHIPWEWSLAFVIRCARHGVTLLEGCPICGDLDPLIFSSLDLSPNLCCRSCGHDLTTDRINNVCMHARKEIEIVEEAYRNALLGVTPDPALLGKTTNQAFRRFIEDLLQLVIRSLNPASSRTPAAFSRQDIVQIVAALIENAMPTLDQSARSKRYKRGLALWSGLFSIIPSHEATAVEKASVRWPLALRRRFASALRDRTRKRWPASPYRAAKDIGRQVSRIEIASVFGLRASMPMGTRKLVLQGLHSSLLFS